MTDLPSDHEATLALEPELPPEEASTFQDVDMGEPVPPADIIAYNEVRSCADLYRLYASGKMEIQPDFQREVVWKRAERAGLSVFLCVRIDETLLSWRTRKSA